MPDDQKSGLSFAKQVPAATTETLEQKVQEDATVEHVQVRIYPGAELTTRVYPEIVLDGSDPVPLIEYPEDGKQYIDGDDDTWSFDVSEPVQEDDLIRVRVENNDGSNAHNVRVNIETDELGGIDRTEKWLMGVLS